MSQQDNIPPDIGKFILRDRDRQTADVSREFVPDNWRMINGDVSFVKYSNILLSMFKRSSTRMNIRLVQTLADCGRLYIITIAFGILEISGVRTSANLVWSVSHSSLRELQDPTIMTIKSFNRGSAAIARAAIRTGPEASQRSSSLEFHSPARRQSAEQSATMKIQLLLRRVDPLDVGSDGPPAANASRR